MSLEVMGCGFARTGTMTTRQALEMLGIGPCHHMMEIIEHPGKLLLREALAAGEAVDWAEVCAGYRSQVDWPGAHVWEQSAASLAGVRLLY
jgi:hypothetical protein